MAYRKLKQCSQDLLQNGTDILEWQRTELILFEKIVQILFQHLEDQTRVVLVSETLERTHKIPLKWQTFFISKIIVVLNTIYVKRNALMEYRSVETHLICIFLTQSV